MKLCKDTCYRYAETVGDNSKEYAYCGAFNELIKVNAKSNHCSRLQSIDFSSKLKFFKEDK